MNKKINLLTITLSAALVVACHGGTNTNSSSSVNQNLRFNTVTGGTGSTCDGLPLWSAESTYGNAGTNVVYQGKRYKNNWWSQGHNPADYHGDAGSGKEWTLLEDCGVAPKPEPTPEPSVSPTASPAPVPTISPTPVPTTSPTPEPKPPVPGQYPKFPEKIGTYTGGTLVIGEAASDNKVYKCKSDQIAPWCNAELSKWAYAPGTGEYWKEAWEEVGGVEPVVSPTPAPQPTTSPAPTPTTSPTPPAPAGEGILFGPYKDATLYISGGTKISTGVTGSTRPVVDVLSGKSISAVTWAFAGGECGKETWANTTSQIIANNAADYNSRGIKYIVSTGGAAGKFTCSSNAGMDEFVNRYMSPSLIGLDFDIEYDMPRADIHNLITQIAYAQKKHPNLRMSFTLATAGNGGSSVNDTGAAVINEAKAAGIKFYVNLMVMDYSNSCTYVDGKCDMNISAQNAAKHLHSAYNIPYANIELTPMIGTNDVVAEIFTLADATNLAKWIKQNGLGGLHYWALDRDTNACSYGSVAYDCSSIAGHAQHQTRPLEFLDTMSKELGTSILK